MSAKTLKNSLPKFATFGKPLAHHLGRRSKLSIGVTVLALVGAVAVWAAKRAGEVKHVVAKKILDDQSLDDRLEQSMDASDAVAKF